MSSLSEEDSIRYNQVKKANPGMTTNQALIASGAGSMVDLNNELYDTGVSSSDVPAYSPEPPITPLDFGKTLLDQVVGNSENPNNLSSERVLQLVRQGVQKPDFMQEYLKNGGVAPQYSVLNDSEYMDAYRTDQVPDLRPQPDSVPYVPPVVEPVQPVNPDQPIGDPRYSYNINPSTNQPPYVPPVVEPVNLVNPDQPIGDPTNYQNTLSYQGMQQNDPPPVSEDLLQGNFQSPLPMYGPPPAQQGYNYNPDVMAKLLQQLSSTQM